MKQYLECGQIIRAHGINGAMVINHLCDSYEVFGELKTVYLLNGTEYKEYKIKKVSPYKSGALVLLDGITTPEEVTRLRTQFLFAKREDILKNEDDYFIADLIGLPVYDFNTGEKYGALKDVINQGAQDIYVIAREGKNDSLIPAIYEFVPKISLEEGIFISPIEGMIE